MRESVVVRVVQHRSVLGDLQANLVDHRARVRAAAEDGAGLVLFPMRGIGG